MGAVVLAHFRTDYAPLKWSEAVVLKSDDRDSRQALRGFLAHRYYRRSGAGIDRGPGALLGQAERVKSADVSDGTGRSCRNQGRGGPSNVPSKILASPRYLQVADIGW